MDWADAVLGSNPKKGDLSLCDNSGGLDMVGKVFAHILKQRLQTVADTELTESQYCMVSTKAMYAWT